MKEKNLQKCSQIIQGFPALKVMSIFGSGKIVRHLKKELEGIGESELRQMQEYLESNLPPADYALFREYLGRAMR